MKIIHEIEKCIGCGSCAAICSATWGMSDDGKAHAVGANKNPADGNEELEIEQIGCNQDAADICPVQCIKIIKK
jgi:ferredoxin